MNRLHFIFRTLLVTALIGAFSGITAQDTLLSQKTTFICETCHPADALDSLFRMKEIDHAYSRDDFRNKKVRNFNFTKPVPLSQVLDSILSGCDLTYKTKKKKVSIFKTQPKNCSIHFIDSTDQNAVGFVSVYLKKIGRESSPIPTTPYTCDENGQIGISLFPGFFLVRTARTGYKPSETRIQVVEAGKNDIYIQLIPTAELLGAISITTANESAYTTTPGTSQIISSNFQKELGPGAVTDITNALTSIPGVSTGLNNLGGMNVRGGSADQNLFLVDDIPVYNPTHAVGIFTIFNHQAIRDVHLYKGNIPARYGSRASSLIDIRTSEGNEKQMHYGIEANLAATTLWVEGPLLKDKKLTLFLSGRKSHLQQWSQLFEKRTNLLNVQFNNLKYNFSDLNGKLAFKRGQHKLSLTFYTGGDFFAGPFTQQTFYENEGTVDDFFRLSSDWGNRLAAFRWLWELPRGWKMVSTTSYSKFTYSSQLDRQTIRTDLQNRVSEEANYSNFYRTNINDLATRIDFSRDLPSRARVHLGGALTRHFFEPGAFSVNFQLPGQENLVEDSLNAILARNNKLWATELESYATIIYPVGKNFVFDGGVNISTFFIDHSKRSAFLPRSTFSYKAPFSRHFLRTWISANALSQYLHQIGSFNFGLPFELWVPSTRNIEPERVIQYAAGVEWKSPLKVWSIKVEAYRKQMKRLLYLIPDEDALLSGGATDANGWEQRIIAGKGNSKGVELEILFHKERWTGQFSFTRSYSERQFAEINYGNPFPYQFDRKYISNTGISYKLFQKFNISAIYLFKSGNPITLASVKYKYTDPLTGEEFSVYGYNRINNYRLPNTHSINAVASYATRIKNGKRATEIKASIGINNLIGRFNPFYLVLDVNSGVPNRAIQYTLLPRFPTMSLELRF